MNVGGLLRYASDLLNKEEEGTVSVQLVSEFTCGGLLLAGWFLSFASGIWPTLSSVDPLAVLTTLIGVAVTTAWAMRVHFRVLGKARDLDRKLAEATALKEAAETQNALKNEFLAALTHEIRTPMNSILAFAELALKTELTAKQRQHLAAVLNSAEWLSRAVSDILNFTRLESAWDELETKDFLFSHCLASAVQVIEPHAALKNLDLSTRIDPAIPEGVCGDPLRLRQILVNLLENAVRFTSSGSVMLSAELEEESQDELALTISVADTGIGIPTELQATIFEPFKGNGTSGSGFSSGAGLGLSICKRLVTKMGGTIEVQSQIGAGSRFHFTLRLGKACKPADRTERLEILRRYAVKRFSILIAEADVASRRFTAKLLESAGHQVTPACSGREAIEAFSRDLFDLVLLDLELPDMDGCKVAGEFRDLEDGTAPTPIYGLVPADSDPDQRERARPGLDGFIEKPVQIDELLRVIGNLAMAVKEEAMYAGKQCRTERKAEA